MMIYKDGKMIVDCHTHINSPGNDAEASEHWVAAETVDACIVLAGSDGPNEETNKKLAVYVNKHKDKMVGFAIVDPIEDNIGVKEIEFLTDRLGFKGLVLYCSACGFHPAHTQAMVLYELAQQMRLPVFFHNSGFAVRSEAVLDYSQPHLLDEIARTFPDLKIVIGNMGVPFVEQALAVVAKHENVYGDLTVRPSNVWETYNIVIAANENGVMDKLIFGSGFPYSRASECIETLLGLNMLLADTNLPTVPRNHIRNVIERESLELLGIKWSYRSKAVSNSEDSSEK
jgi:hypothetical protein